MFHFPLCDVIYSRITVARVRYRYPKKAELQRRSCMSTCLLFVRVINSVFVPAPNLLICTYSKLLWTWVIHEAKESTCCLFSANVYKVAEEASRVYALRYPDRRHPVPVTFEGTKQNIRNGVTDRKPYVQIQFFFVSESVRVRSSRRGYCCLMWGCSCQSRLGRVVFRTSVLRKLNTSHNATHA